MALVKIINTSKARSMTLKWDGKEYPLDAEGGELIIDEYVAKHWLGDWDLKDEDAIKAEQKRVKRLHNDFPNEDTVIKVEPVVESVRTTAPSAKPGPPKKVSSYVKTPEKDEEEFEDLKKVKKTTSRKKKTKK